VPNDSEENSVSPATYLPAPDADPALALEQEDWQERSAGQLHQALGSLDGRARAIIETRWMAEEKATLQELADRFGISAERVRQIEQQALRALRVAVAG
jgi:RNA polymerase sigma-32 factor